MRAGGFYFCDHKVVLTRLGWEGTVHVIARIERSRAASFQRDKFATNWPLFTRLSAGRRSTELVPFGKTWVGYCRGLIVVVVARCSRLVQRGVASSSSSGTVLSGLPRPSLHCTFASRTRCDTEACQHAGRPSDASSCEGSGQQCHSAAESDAADAPAKNWEFASAASAAGERRRCSAR